ncbi:thiamine biosynthesis protein ThiS [Vibrio breoganii]|uniref:sulfur carrier protein ThiS n=1 Tax=Vibrio breoganii TaxID=553239 RepID=UPI000C81CD5A|nr:sulfur carrier protein ThiS [Vibrio breoganii]PMG95206.1 thiamine biosynthesis protein ThiS [Vibrio breoganii]PMK28560.1 thiamine biosynthesis protein ThiS [Vibrio breoganii]PML18966.1 thiamine biosynthesis protein ThiS [Vibrio breoganii]PML34235.1 thiamine biosynthesis protein ThiS [Vibrio breoganii]PMM03621.1 thiamine biosynthesis protein ThiS [Vibrio breoganii]
MNEVIVTINDKPTNIGMESNLIEVLDKQGIPSEGCAIAVNNKVIPKSKWNTIQIQKGDTLSVFRAIAGG